MHVNCVDLQQVHKKKMKVVLISKMFVSRYVCAFVVCLVERRRPRVVGCCVNADNGAFCRKLLLLERKCQKQGWKKWM